MRDAARSSSNDWVGQTQWIGVSAAHLMVSLRRCCDALVAVLRYTGLGVVRSGAPSRSLISLSVQPRLLKLGGVAVQMGISGVGWHRRPSGGWSFGWCWRGSFSQFVRAEGWDGK